MVISGCVSAIDDTSAFGFAEGASSTKVAAVDTAASESNAASETIETPSSDAPDAVAPAAPQIAETGGAAETQTRTRPTTGEKTVAAYAGASLSEGVGDKGNKSAGTDRSLFASLFARSKPRTPIANAQKGKGRRVILKHEGAPTSAPDDSLPGVDPSSLFEIGQRASANEDMLEDVDNSYEVASLSGLARLAPNGLLVQRDSVDTSCFPPKLVGLLRAVEQRYGKRVVVTSGYRSPSHNKRVNGARRSQHMGCKAADIIIPDTDQFAVAKFVRSLPGRGGVGTYCHTRAIHVDVGPKRDWNWRCRRRN